MRVEAALLVLSFVTAACSAAEPRARDAGSPARDDALPLVVAAPAPPIEAESAQLTEPPPSEPEKRSVGPISPALRGGLHNPMPGGVLAGYQADTGLDIAGSPRAVYAIAAGTLDYSEPGHTLWTGPKDTANCVRFELDAPIAYKGRAITHVYYAHLSKLAFALHEGDAPRAHVEAGEYLGVSGVANHSPHLHVGLLLDGDVSQSWGTFLLADAVREVLGGLRNGDILPPLEGDQRLRRMLVERPPGGSARSAARVSR